MAPFLPAVRGTFLHWDDHLLLVDNPLWRGDGALDWMLAESFGGPFGPYQPLTWLSYALDHALFGLDPFWFHATGILLHGLAAVALFSLARALLPLVITEGRWRPGPTAGAAAATALLWAVHPLRVEAVAWVTARRDVLSTLFALLAVRLWLVHTAKHSAPGRWGASGAYWCALALFALAALSKSAVMGLPLVLLLLDVWPLGRTGRSALIIEKLPFAAVAGAVAWMAWIGQTATGAVVTSGEISVPARVMFGLHSAGAYVVRTFWPVDFCAHYARPLDLAEPGAAVLTLATVGIAITTAAVGRARLSPGSAFAWLAFLVLLAPMSGMIPIGSHLTADRYTYLATIPLVLAVVGVFSRPALMGKSTSRRGPVVAIALIVVLGVSSARLVSSWRSDLALWTRVAETTPESWMAQSQLAQDAQRRGDLHAASAYARAAVALRPTADGYARAAWIEIQRNDDAAAAELVRQGLAANADDAWILVQAGILAGRRNDLEQAERRFRRALELDWNHPQANFNLAQVLVATGRPDEAEVRYRMTLDASPGHVKALLALAGRLRDRGDAAGARELIDRVLTLDPGNTAASGWR